MVCALQAGLSLGMVRRRTLIRCAITFGIKRPCLARIRHCSSSHCSPSPPPPTLPPPSPTWAPSSMRPWGQRAPSPAVVRCSFVAHASALMSLYDACVRACCLWRTCSTRTHDAVCSRMRGRDRGLIYKSFCYFNLRDAAARLWDGGRRMANHSVTSILGTLRLDFGTEVAAWLELVAPDLTAVSHTSEHRSLFQKAPAVVV